VADVMNCCTPIQPSRSFRSGYAISYRIKTTFDIYSQVLLGMQEEAAKMFDDEFAPK
jgi:hypothetical protein